LKNEKFFEIFIEIRLAIFENIVYNVINRRKADKALSVKERAKGEEE